MKTGIIVCAAGSGTRVGGEVPKQFIKIGEKRVIDYTLSNILRTGLFDDIVLMIRSGDEKEYEMYENLGVDIVCGDSSEGQNTRRLGLNWLKNRKGYKDDDIVGLADGNRPFISPEDYERLVCDAKIYGSAIPYVIQKEIPIFYRDGKSEPVRESRVNMRETLAPCFLKFGNYWNIYNMAFENGCLQNSEGIVKLLFDERFRRFNFPIHYVEGNVMFFKITTPDDVELAKIIVKDKEK